MFEGGLKEGELQIGRVSALINEIETAAQILQDIFKEYNQCVADVKKY